FIRRRWYWFIGAVVALWLVGPFLSTVSGDGPFAVKDEVRYCTDSNVPGCLPPGTYSTGPTYSPVQENGLVLFTTHPALRIVGWANTVDAGSGFSYRGLVGFALCAEPAVGCR